MSVKKYAIIIVAIVLFALLISRIQTCKPSITVVDAEKQSMQAAIDSLHFKMNQLDWENHILVVKLAESKAKVHVVTKTKEVRIYDTVVKEVRITEYFPDFQYTPIVANSPIESTSGKTLLLPTKFNLKDSTGSLSLSGIIDTQGITLQRVLITNTITLKDDVKKFFFTERHAFSMTQSNPYISSVIPVYLYRKPTRRGLFLQKVGALAFGLGIGYAASELKIFK